MTILVASLFLPYTVIFDGTKSPTDQQSPPVLTTQAVSIFNVSAVTIKSGIPKTPGATTDLEEIFKPGKSAQPFKLRLPNSRSVTRLSALAQRPDTHSPNWGHTSKSNQPSSRARSPPPVSILHRDVLLPPVSEFSRSRNRNASRSVSADRQFTEDNYMVQPARMGNGGLVVALDAATETGQLPEKTWIGTLSMPTNALTEKVRTSIEEKLGLEYNSLIVWVDDNDLDGHYERYSKTILWPHLHYQIPDHPKSKAYEDHSWNFYVKVNQAFADVIIKQWKRGDKIWIHDYHLMLVSRMVRDKLVDAEIGFFMHTAFPSSEIFRCLATRTTLIEGLLGANMIGFQTDEYAHHFLQTCSRLLNVEATKHGIIMDDGRFVHVKTFPIGIDIETLEIRRQDDEVKSWIEKISEKYQGKRLIVARDQLDNIRGVRQKLLAYERFLERYPEYQNQVVLLQIATSGQENPKLEKLITGVITRINSRFSTLAHQPLVFLRQDIDYSQWLALLMVAECLMISSLREGMNLTGHEFVYCQDGTFGKSKHGPLILSEFTGAAAILKDNALLINPWDVTKCARMMAYALAMSPTEKERRWTKLQEQVLAYNATNWYNQYMKALAHAYNEHSIRDATSVPRLSQTQLQKSYAQATKRLLVLDYEGTLAVWDSPGETVAPTPQRAIDVLNGLLEDDKNIVYVMSGRSSGELESLFSRVTGLGLIAENGAYLREVGSQEWKCACDMNHVAAWKDGVRDVLEYYQERIRGSKIEEFNTFLILHYDQAEDAETAFKQCGECASHISDVCSQQGVHAVPIDRGICVSSIEINKSTAMETISKKLIGTELPDFLLVIGDSREDEYVFDWAGKMKNVGVKEVITASVGTRNTAASATMGQGVVGVLSALRKLAAL